MSTDSQAVADTLQSTRTRALLATVAGWVGLVLIILTVLYWAVTGNFDTLARIGLILGLLGLGVFGLLNPQGIIEVVAGRGTRNILGTTLLIALALGILVAINIIYSEIGKRQPAAVLRTDLTAGQSNTLSPQSIRVVQDLTQTVTAYEFFGTQSTDITQQRTADNLLKEYASYSNKLKIQSVNPDQAIGLANQYGLTRYDVVVFDSGLQHQVATTTDEQTFTSAILKLHNNVQKTLAILNIPSALDFSGSGGAQAVAATVARSGLDKENYVVLPPYNLVVSPTISVKDVSVMIVPPPATGKPIPDAAVRALSDYLDHGGHVLLLGDPLAAPLPAALLQKYGLSEARGIVVEQNNQNLWGPSPVDLLLLSYPTATITRDMNNVPTAYQAAEPIVVATQPITGFTTTPFIQSSASALYGVLKADANGQQTLQQDPNGPAAPMNIGVTVEQTITATGNFTSSTPANQNTTRLAVIGDYDFISDQLTSQVPGNLDMFYNTVNWLSASDEQISVRPADATVRQLTLSGAQQNLIAWGTMVFLPALVLIGGGFVWWRRR